MTEQEKRPTSLACSTDELRKAILENPNLPLLVFASEDANSGDYGYMSCGRISVDIGEFLDCRQTINDEFVFTDRDEFEEAMNDSLYDEYERFIDNLGDYHTHMLNSVQYFD